LDSSKSYSVVPDLELEVRPCIDGVLIFEGISRSTHLLSPAAWELFLAILDGKENDPVGDDSRRQLIGALESAGLVSRC
jgi:hypothetical protein